MMPFEGSDATAANSTIRVDGAALAPRHAADHDLTLVVPCFNERSRLPRTLETLRSTLDDWRIDYRVLIVDDGSRDGTPDLVDAFGGRFSALRLPANRGKGGAVRAGMLAAGGRIVAFTDADLPYELDSLRAGYERLTSTDADAAFGSRVLAAESPTGQGRRVRSPLLRRAAGGVFRKLVRRLVTAPVTDTQCGLKFFRREAARRVFSQATIDGFAFDVEVIYLAHRLQLRWSEIPVVLVNEGESTVSLRRHGPAMLRDLAKLAWRDLRGTAFVSAAEEGATGEEAAGTATANIAVAAVSASTVSASTVPATTERVIA